MAAQALCGHNLYGETSRRQFKECKKRLGLPSARHEEAHSDSYATTKHRRMAAIPAVFIGVTGD
jgi:hypothetical protein